MKANLLRLVPDREEWTRDLNGRGGGAYRISDPELFLLR